MNPVNNGALGERTSRLEARMDIQEKKTDELSVIAGKLADSSARAEGEKAYVDKLHIANRWRLDAIIGILMLLLAYETFIRDRRPRAPDQQKQTQAAPPAHSALPPGYVASIQ